MDTEIKRIYLSHKIEKCYPYRYHNAVFEKFNEMNSDTQFQNCLLYTSDAADE